MSTINGNDLSMMLSLKFIPLSGIFISLLSPLLVIFPCTSLQPPTQSNLELKISVKFPPTDNRGTPTRTVGGGRRSPDPSCTKESHVPLTALMPTRDNVGTTILANPTFFWYVPKTTANSAEFVIVDDKKNEVYVTSLNLSGTSGVLKFTLPTTVSLKVGKDYTWNFALICNPVDRSRDEIVEGVVRRSQMSVELKTKLQQASPSEQAQIYAQAKIWFEALATIASLRNSQPGQWEELLKSVGLKDIVQEPFAHAAQ